MENTLTSDKKAEYKSIRDDFQKERDKINKDISKHKLVYEEAKKEISGLEKEIESLRPVIKDCDKHISCEKCDIYSMKYMGSTPNPEKYHIYECVLCGHEERYT
jgi:chromosome segregation ATPase